MDFQKKKETRYFFYKRIEVLFGKNGDRILQVGRAYGKEKDGGKEI